MGRLNVLKCRAAFFAMLIFLSACGGENSATNIQGTSSLPSSVSGADLAIDEKIKIQVESAITSAKDLPAGFSVQVTEGVVQITGSVVCEECGGMRTPGHIGTSQQSLGGVVRAIPGVMNVDFDLSYGPDYPAPTL